MRRSRMNRASSVWPIGLGVFVVCGAGACQTPEWPATRAELSGYLETSRYDDVTTFLGALEGRNPLLQFTEFGYSEEGRPLPLTIFGRVHAATPDAVIESGRTRVLVFANIHAGEVAGKETALTFVRELAQGRHDDLADSLVILVVPIYNADGNERVRLRNRPRQHGPFAGMGQRENALGLDLNRDNTKLEAAETRALIRLVRDYDVHVAIDLHTTNGTFHGYHLTYSPPLHPSTDPAITELLRGEWLPAVTEAVRREHDWAYYYYGNVPGTFGMRGERGWYTFDYRPRYTTNYLGLANRFGILSEAYSYATFEDRIAAHGRFVEEVIRFAFRNASRVREAVSRSVAGPAPGMEVVVRADFMRGDTVEVLLGEVDEERNPYTGEIVYRRRVARIPERMPDFGTFEPVETVWAPAAYVIPADFDEAIERLEAHGLWMARLDRDSELEVEILRVDSTRVADREYQGHRLRETWGAWEAGTELIPAGAVIVPVGQPLGRLVVLLLEPRSEDGLAAWNFFEAGPGGPLDYPVRRLRKLPDTFDAEL